MITKQTQTLYRAHRVLISTAAACSLVMSFWGFRLYRVLHDAPHILAGIFGIAAALGLLGYLRYFNRKVAREATEAAPR